MLRAGKMIIINKDELISENGIIIAPIINLCGLVLRVDRLIPDTITAFLKNEDVNVETIRYKNESFIRLSGVYNLRKTKIQGFIDANQALIEAQFENLDAVPESKALADEVATKIKKLNHELSYEYAGTNYTFSKSVKKDTLHIFTPESLKNTGRMGSHSDVTIRVKRLSNQGLNIGNIGFFSESSAKDNHSIESQYGLHENACVDSGKTIQINTINKGATSHERLYINQSKFWINQPHKQTTDALLAEADDILLTIRSGGIL